MNCELYMIQTFKLNLKELILLDEDFMEELINSVDEYFVEE